MNSESDLTCQFLVILCRILNIQNPATTSLLRTATRTISNLCRGRLSLPLEAVDPVLQTLLSLLCRDVECDIAIKAMWALSYIAGADNEYHRQRMMETSLMAKLVEIIKSDCTPALIAPALQCIGRLVAGEQTQKVLDSRILKYISHLLEHSTVRYICELFAEIIFSFKAHHSYCLSLKEKHKEGSMLGSFEDCWWNF